MKLIITKAFAEDHKTKEVIDAFIKQRKEKLAKKHKNIETKIEGDSIKFTYEAK